MEENTIEYLPNCCLFFLMTSSLLDSFSFLLNFQSISVTPLDSMNDSYY